MNEKEVEHLYIINILKKNNIYYEIEFNLFKLIIHIPQLNISIYKYFFNNIYYVYYQNKFIKKIEFYV